MLLKLANLEYVNRQSPRNISASSHKPVDHRHLDHLIKMYKLYGEKYLLFNEQVRILTLVPVL